MTEVLDLDALEGGLDVKLGGKMLKAKELTVEENKEILRKLVEAESESALDDDSPEASLRNLESVYEQVKRILIDPKTGKAPTQAFAEKHLTTRKLRKLMDALNDADDSPGNSEPSPATST